MDEVEICLKQNYELLKNCKLPKSYIDKPLEMITGDLFISNGKYTNWRDLYIKSFGFPLYAENWIRPLAQWIGPRPCLEVGAGTGHLSYFLKSFGCDVIATDNYSWAHKLDMTTTPLPVENIDAVSAVHKYGEFVKFVICSWPYMDDTAFNVLKAMKKVNESCRMIYIGEGNGGCTANEKFFDNMEICEVKSFYEAVKKYRHWYGIYDYLLLVKPK